MINVMEEIWKDIVIKKNGVVYDYEGLYEVSNMGRVRNVKTGRMLKLLENGKCYLFVRLCKNSNVEMFYVHRLVATMFIPNDDPIWKTEVNHKDFDRLNNIVTNLEWTSHQENVQHSYTANKDRAQEHKHKLSKLRKGKYTGAESFKAKKVVCLETGQIFGSIRDAEQWCGKIGVSNCCRGKSKTSGGYHWMYLDDYRRKLRMESDINNSRLVA